MFNRREFLAVSALGLPGFLGLSGFLGLPGFLRAAPLRFSRLPVAFAQLEQLNGGRLGVAVLDTGSGGRAHYRAGERFPMCSTFKFLLASAVLRRVDAQQETLERALAIPAKPLLFNSPLSEPHAAGTMTIAALCHAALTRSDNTAANLLLESIGGPPGITAFSRSIGDTVTRLDRMETSLNESLAGDPRDTTSPAAMAGDLQSVLLGDILSRPSRDQLTLWMEASLTGLERLRAGLPGDWRAADKTGANGRDTSNDIAILWPPGKPPVIVTAYITQCAGPESKRAAVLVEIGRLARETLN
jgi:beta-lactamase class A